MTQQRISLDYLRDIRAAAEKAIVFLGCASLATFEQDDKTVYAVIPSQPTLARANIN